MLAFLIKLIGIPDGVTLVLDQCVDCLRFLRLCLCLSELKFSADIGLLYAEVGLLLVADALLVPIDFLLWSITNIFCSLIGIYIWCVFCCKYLIL